MSLPKIIVLTMSMFAFASTTHAHPTHNTKPAHHATASFHWTWQTGHWAHGHWVKGHWSKRPGKHPHTRQSGWHWIDGHYVGHGPHRHWVPGHWKMTREPKRIRR